MEDCPGICEPCPLNQLNGERRQAAIAQRSADEEAREQGACSLNVGNLTLSEGELLVACFNRKARSQNPIYTKKLCQITVQ